MCIVVLLQIRGSYQECQLRMCLWWCCQKLSSWMNGYSVLSVMLNAWILHYIEQNLSSEIASLNGNLLLTNDVVLIMIKTTLHCSAEQIFSLKLNYYNSKYSSEPILIHVTHHKHITYNYSAESYWETIGIDVDGRAM